MYYFSICFLIYNVLHFTQILISDLIQNKLSSVHIGQKRKGFFKHQINKSVIQLYFFHLLQCVPLNCSDRQVDRYIHS